MPGRAEFIIGRRGFLAGFAATSVAGGAYWFGQENEPVEPQGQQLSLQLGSVSHTFQGSNVERRGNQVNVTTIKDGILVPNGVTKDGARPLHFVQFGFVNSPVSQPQIRSVAHFAPLTREEINSEYKWEVQVSGENTAFNGKLTVFTQSQEGIHAKTYVHGSDMGLQPYFYPQSRVFQDIWEVHNTEFGLRRIRNLPSRVPLTLGEDGVVGYLYEAGLFKAHVPLR